MTFDLPGPIQELTVWLEEPQTFPWREAMQIKLTIGKKSVLIFSEFVPLAAWDDALGTVETSQLRLSDEDHGLDLHEAGVEQSVTNRTVDRQDVLVDGERLVGLELYNKEDLLWGFYSNHGSFFVNFSDDFETCTRIKESLAIGDRTVLRDMPLQP